MQIVRFYDGRIRITLLGLTASDGIIGLSRGLGMKRLECEIAGEFGHLLSRSGRVDEAAALMTQVSAGWPEGDAAARAVAERRLRAAGWTPPG